MKVGVVVATSLLLISCGAKSIRLSSTPRVICHKKYRNANMPIRFELSDTLSGFEDDRNILIKLDGNWMIPEYDPETFICQTAPIKSLEPGEHHLAIVVTDRMGNKSEKYLKFWIRAKSKKR